MTPHDILFAPTPAWHLDAACRDTSPRLFYPEPGDNGNAAIAICTLCPVKAECRQAGASELHGIWGGQGVRNRRHHRTTRP